MLVFVIVGIIIAFIVGIYSCLSLDSKIMRYYPFCWFPICRFYNKAFYAISKLESMTPIERGYYADALGQPVEEKGVIDNKVSGFKELVIAMQKAKMVSQPINKIILGKLTHWLTGNNSGGISEKAWFILKFYNKDELLNELPLPSTLVLKDAVESVIKYRFAIFSLVLTTVLFLIGITLVIIDIGSKP